MECWSNQSADHADIKSEKVLVKIRGINLTHPLNYLYVTYSLVLHKKTLAKRQGGWFCWRNPTNHHRILGTKITLPIDNRFITVSSQPITSRLCAMAYSVRLSATMRETVFAKPSSTVVVIAVLVTWLGARWCSLQTSSQHCATYVILCNVFGLLTVYVHTY